MFNNDDVYDLIKSSIKDEIEIEIQDKKQMHDDGVDISSEYVEDFRSLKKILYHNMDYYNKRRRLKVSQIRDLLNYIDDEIDKAMTYVKYNIIMR
jgi:hypothetical protein